MLASTMSSHATGITMSMLLTMAPAVMGMKSLFKKKDKMRVHKFGKGNGVNASSAFPEDGTYVSVKNGILHIPKGFHQRLQENNYIRASKRDGDQHILHYPILIKKQILDKNNNYSDVCDIISDEFITANGNDYELRVTLREAYSIDIHLGLPDEDRITNKCKFGLVSIIFNIRVAIGYPDFKQGEGIIKTMYGPLKMHGYFMSEEGRVIYNNADETELEDYENKVNKELGYSISVYHDPKKNEVGTILHEYPARKGRFHPDDELFVAGCESKDANFTPQDKSEEVPTAQIPSGHQEVYEELSVSESELRSPDAIGISTNEFTNECCTIF